MFFLTTSSLWLLLRFITRCSSCRPLPVKWLTSLCLAELNLLYVSVTHSKIAQREPHSCFYNWFYCPVVFMISITLSCTKAFRASWTYSWLCNHNIKNLSLLWRCRAGFVSALPGLCLHILSLFNVEFTFSCPLTDKRKQSHDFQDFFHICSLFNSSTLERGTCKSIQNGTIKGQKNKCKYK